MWCKLFGTAIEGICVLLLARLSTIMYQKLRVLALYNVCNWELGVLFESWRCSTMPREERRDNMYLNAGHARRTVGSLDVMMLVWPYALFYIIGYTSDCERFE